MAKIEVNPNFCKACEYCVHFCPKGVLALGKVANNMGYHAAVPVAIEKCIGCKQCAVVCPEGAISVYR